MTDSMVSSAQVGNGPASRQVWRARLVTPAAVLDDAVLALDGDTIVYAGPVGGWVAGSGWPSPERVAGTLLPGLVDAHNHGGEGHGFCDGDLTGARAAAAHHLTHGTTSLLASLVTAPEGDLLTALEVCADLTERGEVAGIALEGPFLSPARAGAQDAAAMVAPDLALLDRLLAAGLGHVRSLTYAPELPGAAELAARMLDADVLPSIGHTDCDMRTAARALDQAAGSSSVTHLFNAMPPMHHRAPGPAAAALAAAARGQTVVELVADGVHLADETVSAVFDLVGPHHVALVTDATAAAGVANGRHRLGRTEIEVVEGVARVAGEGSAEQRPIAGGTTCLVDVVRRVVRHAGVGLADAVAAASTTPARLLGIDDVTGSLRPGLRADVLVLDADLVPLRVMRAGRWVR